jgi:uncharacterized protein YbaA (DUF1428 family)
LRLGRAAADRAHCAGVLGAKQKFEEVHMPVYVDGFVLPVPKKNVEAYRKIAKKACKVWLDHGAIDYRECIADDVKPGKWTSFPQSVKLKPNETVVFAWITYKSRKHRDRVNAKVMKDPRLTGMEGDPMPFDGKRMIFGGFTTLVEV